MILNLEIIERDAGEFVTYIALIEKGVDLVAGRGDTEREAAAAAINAYFREPPTSFIAPALSTPSGGNAETTVWESDNAPFYDLNGAVRLIEDAISLKQNILLHYTDARDNSSVRKIEPSRIEERRGTHGFFEATYLIAVDVDKDEPRTFRLDQIKRMEII